MIKLHLIGQAPPKPPGPILPFGRSKLYPWLSQIGLNEFFEHEKRAEWNKVLTSEANGEKVLLAFDAIYNQFPGSNKAGHLIPTRDQILICKNYLENSLNEIDADIIIPIGKLAISYCLDLDSYNSEIKKVKEAKLESVIGKEFVQNPFGLIQETKKIIALPHPSGASSWVYNETNKILLKKALNLIGKEVEKS